MKDKTYGLLFRTLRPIVRIFYPKYTIRLPADIEEKGPVVYVSHHQNLFGPFVILLWYPRFLRTWILHVFFHQEDCFRQYVDYTFTKRYGWNRTIAKFCAYPISFFISKLMNSAGGLPVYRGSRRILKTFRLSIEALTKGESIAIYPDIEYSDQSSSIKEFYDGFLYIEKYYFKETGRHVPFVPLYVSKYRKQIIAGNTIVFEGKLDFNDERFMVKQQIQNELNLLAEKCGDLKHGG